MSGKLHHLEILSPDCARLAGFYRDVLGMWSQPLDDGRWLCGGRNRRLLFAPGKANTLGFAAYSLETPAELAALERRLARSRIPAGAALASLFGAAGIAVSDPDGSQLVFGLAEDAVDHPHDTPGLSSSPRLQHVVMASTDCARIAAFYADPLGFTVSDRVYRKDGDLTTCFLRSDEEHHSFAVFQASQCRFDHHCYETEGWHAIRDWADRFASLGVPLQWGPGRHGPGNNLFIFIHDPDGNWVELSAEIEHVAPGRPAGAWPHEERTLNLWGRAPLRS